MQKKFFILFISFIFISIFSFASQTDTLKVPGSCGECKDHIEKAAKAAGASVADWNQKSKLLVVSYDEAVTSRLAIEKKIAESGYDTQDVKATDDAYNNLEECCQYKRQ